MNQAESFLTNAVPHSVDAIYTYTNYYSAKMNTQLEQTLSKLAEKFGTSVEHLWGVMVAQARVEAVMSTIFAAVAAVIVVAAVIIAIMAFKRFRDDDYDESAFVALITVPCIAIVAFFVGCACTKTAITCFCNPEFWAITQILK